MAARKRAETWTLENGEVRMEIEKAGGWISSLVWKNTGLDLFRQLKDGIPGYRGGIAVYDEHDRVFYSDLETPFTIKRAFKRGNRVVCEKRFRGAPFEVRITFLMHADALEWKVEAWKAGKHVADRSLRVHFLLPLVAGWHVWAPCNYGEHVFDGMTPFEFMYTQIPYVSEQEVILPLVSHYSPGDGVGYSVAEPIHENVPAGKFVFNNGRKCFNWGSMRKDMRDVPVLETINYYIGLVGRRSLRTSVFVFFHEGDWRPGLGKVYARWKEFFDPWNDSIYEREGVFRCGNVRDADNVGMLKKMGVKMLEVHGHFQDYSDYFQEGKEKWLTIRVKEGVRHAIARERNVKAGPEYNTDLSSYRLSDAVEEFIASHTDEEIARKAGVPVEEMYLTRREIKRRLKKLAAAGISCHWYFNYTDGYRPKVEKEWPDSIARTEDGGYMRSGWYMCHNMNPDPRWSFGKFCIESARKIFEEYPMLHGLFLDCFRHYEIDFGHDDGVTVVNGKPCYSINRSYDDVERIIKERIMKPLGLTSFANKPVSIRSMRYVDAQLLEGNGDQYEEKFFWASIACPLFFMWTQEGASLDENLRRAVLHGAYPRDAEPTEENIRLYRKYLPLYRCFHRRVFCFEPDPLRVPPGSRGKLYTVKDGYVAGIVNLHIDAEDTVTWGRTPYALFRVERGHDVGKVGVMYPGDRRWRFVSFKFDGTFIAVPMRRYKNCAVVKLFVTGRSRKKIGRETFASRPRMCGDPESAFEDVSAR